MWLGKQPACLAKRGEQRVERKARGSVRGRERRSRDATPESEQLETTREAEEGGGGIADEQCEQQAQEQCQDAVLRESHGVHWRAAHGVP